MSITDELRKWGYGFCGDTYDVVTAIADRIDSEHESACAEAYGNGVQSVGLPDMTAYVKLPVDADGVPIHIGDVMEPNGVNSLFVQAPFEVRAMRYGECGWEVYDRLGDRYIPSLLRHHHAPTVEDVLREFVAEFNRDDTELCDEEIIERFAAKLQLRGDAE